MMKAAGFYIPKYNPIKPLGEDSYFINQESQVIGVADGVGGWSKKGIDAGKYARELMRNAAVAVLDHSAAGCSIDPKQVLETAFWNTTAKGTSTACIVAIDHKSNLLRAANLGDSGFLVIRDGKTVYRSPVQQKRFNHPYQIGTSSDIGPEKADEIEVSVEEGDVVIVGSDGLFDNVFEQDIDEIVRLCMAEKYTPDLVALKLAMVAHHKSLERNTVSPFEVAAHEAEIPHFGGKYDDITVVAAYICKADEMEVEVEEGDVVIVENDGLFDNIFGEDIEEIVRLCIANKYPRKLVAWKLSAVAHNKSLEKNTFSPFQVAAHEAEIPHFGGKYDDITVVAAAYINSRI